MRITIRHAGTIIEIILPDRVEPRAGGAAGEGTLDPGRTRPAAPAANPIETGIPVSNESCDGVESRHAKAGNIPGSVPGEETSSAPSRLVGSTEVGCNSQTRAGVAPGSHDTELNATPAGAVVAIASGVTAGETAPSIESRRLSEDPEVARVVPPASILADPDVIALIGEKVEDNPMPAFLDRRVRAA